MGGIIAPILGIGSALAGGLMGGGGGAATSGIGAGVGGGMGMGAGVSSILDQMQRSASMGGLPGLVMSTVGAPTKLASMQAAPQVPQTPLDKFTKGIDQGLRLADLVGLNPEQEKKQQEQQVAAQNAFPNIPMIQPPAINTQPASVQVRPTALDFLQMLQNRRF